MRSEDFEAFEAWYTSQPAECEPERIYELSDEGMTELTKECVMMGWQAALAHRDAQPAGGQGEPVGQIDVDMGEAFVDFYEDKMHLIKDGDEVYLTLDPAPAVAVNEQLLEALKLTLENGQDYTSVRENSRAAIAEAEKAKAARNKAKEHGL